MSQHSLEGKTVQQETNDTSVRVSVLAVCRVGGTSTAAVSSTFGGSPRASAHPGTQHRLLACNKLSLVGCVLCALLLYVCSPYIPVVLCDLLFEDITERTHMCAHTMRAVNFRRRPYYYAVARLHISLRRFGAEPEIQPRSFT